MIRFMLDSDKLADLPAGAAPVLGTYSDLVRSADVLSQLRQLHAGSEIVLIDRGLSDPTGLASVADVETGAMKPSDLPAWFDRKATAKIGWLTCYSNRANMAACDEALGARPHWRWIATLDGTCHITGFDPLRGPGLIQFAGENLLGLHADASLILNPNWHPGPAGQLAELVDNYLGAAQTNMRQLQIAIR